MVIDKKVRMRLVGLDGNAFMLIGAFRANALEQGWTPEEADAVTTAATTGDYNHLLATLGDHVTHREPRSRRGFTLIEMLLVLTIIGILIAVCTPMVIDAAADRGPRQGAATVQAAIAEARDLAARGDAAGVRLVPDPAWQFRRLRDGTLDPTLPIAYSTLVPLTQPPPYSSGLAVVHPAADYSARFLLPGRLILEESPLDADGRKPEPTSWAWNLRVGDEVQYLGRSFTVTGPCIVPIGAKNPEGFINYGPPGASTRLKRLGWQKGGVAGPVDVEWLYLTNRLDDDGDGFTDEGWDGRDNDLDGLIDEDDEWEAESWRGLDGTRPSVYAVERRPVETGGARTTTLPASVVIDATSWTIVGFNADGTDARMRSQVPVDLFTGSVDLLFDASGRVSTPTRYGRLAAPTLGRPWVHLWIAEREDVVSPPVAARRAALASVNVDTGRVVATSAFDASDPAGAFQMVEGGGR